jgi:2-oxoglutarate ferredoxin oxidoreductase subunit beta
VTVITPLASYRTERPYPFCPGCGHSAILDALNHGLVRRGADPASVVIVSDIGCSGLSDEYFATSAFHGLHGRSITYASGIKLARPELDVVVIMGDGGAGIGGAHLISAARRNIGITLLVMNNLNFGMTGGQHSVTTPVGSITASTPLGNLERPLDICATAAVNGAGHVWRGTSFDDDLGDRIADAMDFAGFSLLDIWELCTAYFVRRNQFSRRDIVSTLGELGFATGIIENRPGIPEFAAAHRAAAAASPPPPPPQGVTPVFEASLDRPFTLVLAGAAGGRVRTAARLLATSAILSGLFAAQTDDYPVTVRSGHSVTTLTLSPEPVVLAGAPEPDAILLLSPEGAAKVTPALKRLDASALVLTLPELLAVPTPAKVITLEPPQEPRLSKANRALAGAAAALELLSPFPTEALVAAAGQGAFAQQQLEVVAAGTAMGAAAKGRSDSLD